MQHAPCADFVYQGRRCNIRTPQRPPRAGVLGGSLAGTLPPACTCRVHACPAGWRRARAPAQEALGVGEGEVEVWVVRAIGRKLLAARIDQMRRTVAVTKCAQRTFSAAQWRALLAQLGAWKARPRRPAAPAPGLRWSLRRCRLHMLLAPLCSWLMQLVFISAARSS